MKDQQLLFSLIKEGKVDGYQSVPVLVETVISRVFIFEEEMVLKFYKRDNDWWNQSMQSISAGQSRIEFIRQDFSFNRFLNPDIYVSLKTAVIINDRVVLRDPEVNDDELVIVMKKMDFSKVLSSSLISGTLASDDFENIGKSFADIKLKLPKSFLPKTDLNWYEQMKLRLQDLAEWIESEKDYPAEVAALAISQLNAQLDNLKSDFASIEANDLLVAIDCNTENLVYNHHHLSFVDAYPPKNDWRAGTLEMDIFRVGADIYALGGLEAFNAYWRGIEDVLGDRLNKRTFDFYLLYGVMIASPYFVMLSSRNKKYLEMAKKYLDFVRSLLARR